MTAIAANSTSQPRRMPSATADAAHDAPKTKSVHATKAPAAACVSPPAPVIGEKNASIALEMKRVWLRCAAYW